MKLSECDKNKKIRREGWGSDLYASFSENGEWLVHINRTPIWVLPDMYNDICDWAYVDDANADNVVGTKNDNNKLRYSLVPARSLKKIIEVLEYGAKKYQEDNWKYLSNAKKRYIDAALRHIYVHLEGSSFDDESKLEHLAHAASSLLFALYFD